MPKSAWKAKRHTVRAAKRSRKRARAALDRRAHSTPTPQRASWFGDRRPVIAAKSNELIVFRLEHQADTTKRILPRAERGCNIIALNGRILERKTA